LYTSSIAVFGNFLGKILRRVALSTFFFTAENIIGGIGGFYVIIKGYFIYSSIIILMKIIFVFFSKLVSNLMLRFFFNLLFDDVYDMGFKNYTFKNFIIIIIIFFVNKKKK
jgi:hypothetical protein